MATGKYYVCCKAVYYIERMTSTSTSTSPLLLFFLPFFKFHWYMYMYTLLQMKNTGGYKPGQLLLKIGGLDFLKTLETEEYFSVSHEEPVCVLKPAEGG